MGRTTVGVCCTRRRDDEVEILMVHDRSGRWTLPKGKVERREDLTAAAVRETAEEAGVHVVVDPGPQAVWKHRRRKGKRDDVHLLHARAVTTGAPERAWRRPTWVSVAVLQALADETDHYRRIAAAVRRLGVRSDRVDEGVSQAA